jgi:hypothetical protein
VRKALNNRIYTAFSLQKYSVLLVLIIVRSCPTFPRAMHVRELSGVVYLTCATFRELDPFPLSGVKGQINYDPTEFDPL